MTKTRKKADFPNKICPVCGLPFTWRKRWARNWDEIVYCSDRCRRQRHGGGAASPRSA